VVTKRAASFIWFKGMLEFEKQVSFIPELDDLDEPAPSLAGVIG